MNKTKDTIVLVDAEKANCDQIPSFLGNKYDYHVVDSGTEAISYLNTATAKPTLVIASTNTTAISGLELLSALKAAPAYHKIPFILIADESDAASCESAVNAGADEILTLPFLPALCKRRIENILELHPNIYYKNIMENLVIEEVDQCIDELGICTCPTCRNDLIALTLNHLPSKYVNTEKGEVLSKVEKLSASAQTNIITCIATAAEIIKKNPRH